jgi:uncharacterized protein
VSRVAIALAALALVGCGSSSGHPAARTVSVRLGDGQVRAEIAADDSARTRGLSGRSSLAEGRGMLFVYDGSARRTYWMKGMRFPIDIIWIAAGRVTGVERDAPVPAGGRLPLYSSDGPADHVLELRAGWARRHGVERGDPVKIGR